MALANHEGHKVPEVAFRVRENDDWKTVTTSDIFDGKTVVVFSLPESSTVDEFMQNHEKSPFSRIPLYQETPDHVTGFVLRNEILLAAAKNQRDTPLSELARPIHTVPEKLHLTAAFDQMVTDRMQVIQYFGRKLKKRLHLLHQNDGQDFVRRPIFQALL